MPSPTVTCFDIWLEAGRTGRLFTYTSDPALGLHPGDLVRVRLRGRPMNGIVIAKKVAFDRELLKSGSLQRVEALLQKAAVDPNWRIWLDAMAERCYTSPFRMLKAALPPGWLGQARASSLPAGRKFWWVQRLVFDEIKHLTKRQRELLIALDQNNGGNWQRKLEAAGFSSAVVNALENKGCIRREKRRPNFDNIIPSIEIESPRKLTAEQQVVVAEYESLEPGEGLLLWGITGSGKTEVYLQLAAKELAARRNVLLLTPEIGLIPQLVDRCRRRFGSQVFEYHSGCTDGERLRLWRSCIESDNPLLIVGTRSAVFIPLNPLGLVVLDEEHDSSYKQDSPMPCYHARDLAMDRVRREGGKILLGSATPSIETWLQLKPDGPLHLSRLNKRISQQNLPEVHVVDMRNELADGHRCLISRPMMERLAALSDKGEQAVILVPRRGYSSFLGCRSCGEVVQCPHCDVSLTLHRNQLGQEWLRCHWCDHRSDISSRCAHCGSTAFKAFGAGTQRILKLLSDELKGLRLLRFDRDSTGGRDGHRRLLNRFARGEADVLIGTQMLAKGMDLPRVTLAGVLAADGILHRPDIRAGEQALQLFLQLAGRTGRGKLPGQVLIQTYCPDHPVIRHLVDGRYEEFLSKEVALRKGAGLVPFSRACLLRLSGESASSTATAASVLAQRINHLCKEKGWWLMGPVPAPVARVAGLSRWQLLLHGPTGSSLPLPAGNELWEELPRGVFLSVDPDPLEL